MTTTKNGSGRLGRNPFETPRSSAEKPAAPAKKKSAAQVKKTSKPKMDPARKPETAPPRAEPAFTARPTESRDRPFTRGTCLTRATRWATIDLPAKAFVLGLKTLLVLSTTLDKARRAA